MSAMLIHMCNTTKINIINARSMYVYNVIMLFIYIVVENKIIETVYIITDKEHAFY